MTLVVYVVSYIQDCDNQWVSAVFENRNDAEEWVKNQEKDDKEYSLACGYFSPEDYGVHEIQQFVIRSSAVYTDDDINGLKVNYEGVLKKRGFIAPEGSNYNLVEGAR